MDKAAIQEAYNEVMADNNNVEWSVKNSYSWNCSIKSVITFTFVVATLLCHVCYVTSDQVNKLSNSKLRLFEIKTKFDSLGKAKSERAKVVTINSGVESLQRIQIKEAMSLVEDRDGDLQDDH